ncbi:MAG: LEA type 2 family protein [Methanoregulaceae archaeon]|nr:LEA type 2 family protein [Methanoregulaceae archaeon]MCC7468307.1 LEA type 2 family protein [Burkholderiaceae bacterium]NLH25950.1 LEA type 2 family protein [Methanomicrobiales archaeon]HNW81201.1 LEA type 2 family protein [Methanoregulaceae archaeon]HOU81420.1 LEA type 2 family protein [Methanoregulaceae archaeon]
MNHSAVFLLCLVVSGLLISGCSSPAPMPEVEVEGAAVSSFSLAELTLDIFLSVDNPYPVSITLQSVSFDVYYLNGNEWKYLAHGEQTGIPVNPGKNPVSIPVTIQNVDLLGSLLSFAESREVTLEIRGVVVPDLPGGISPEIPFTKKVTLTP